MKKTRLFSLLACMLTVVMLLSACGTTPPRRHQGPRGSHPRSRAGGRDHYLLQL